VLAILKIAATEENQLFLHSFLFPTFPYNSCAVILATHWPRQAI